MLSFFLYLWHKYFDIFAIGFSDNKVWNRFLEEENNINILIFQIRCLHSFCETLYFFFFSFYWRKITFDKSSLIHQNHRVIYCFRNYVMSNNICTYIIPFNCLIIPHQSSNFGCFIGFTSYINGMRNWWPIWPS